MGFTRPWGRRALALVVAPVIVSSALAVGGTQIASADPSNPTPVSSAALPTAQVNGVVWTQVINSGIDFVGGRFTQSRPAGASDGVDATPRANLFAFDVTTGVAVAGFSATTNAQVRTIAVSPDGNRIYIGGDFTVVNGRARDHLAALDRAGNLLSTFTTAVNGSVFSIATRGDVVYVGGSFTAVGAVARSRAAAVSSSGTVLSFAPAVGDYTVRAITVSNDSSKVLLGGSFSQVNGATHFGLAAVDATSGSSLPWAANSLIYNRGVNSAIYSLTTRGDVAYATGYVYGGAGDGNLEGSIAMNWADGSVKWVEDCHGDTYSGYAFNDAFYIAGHPHFCGNVGGYAELYPSARRALAFSQSATHTLEHNTTQGPATYADFGGQPAPTLLNWNPSLTAGTFTGAGQAAWSVTGGGAFLVYGGEFIAVNGVSQTGLVRFRGQPEPADTTSGSLPISTPTPTSTPSSTPTATAVPTPPASHVVAPSSPRSPRTVAIGTSRIAVKWAAPSGGAKVTRYTVALRRGGKTVGIVKLTGAHLRAVVSHLKRGTTYQVTVAARNAGGTSKATKAIKVRTKKSGATVSPTAIPRKAKLLSVKARGKHALRVVWKAPSVKGATPISSYRLSIYRGTALQKTIVVHASSRAAMVNGLKTGTAYRVAVQAENFGGWGPASSRLAARTVR